jgi:hypothetical protein
MPRRHPYSLTQKRVKKSPFRTIEKAVIAERNFKAGKSIGFTKKASLKSMGRIPRADGFFLLGEKYSKNK